MTGALHPHGATRRQKYQCMWTASLSQPVLQHACHGHLRHAQLATCLHPWQAVARVLSHLQVRKLMCGRVEVCSLPVFMSLNLTLNLCGYTYIASSRYKAKPCTNMKSHANEHGASQATATIVHETENLWWRIRGNSGTSSQRSPIVRDTNAANLACVLPITAWSLAQRIRQHLAVIRAYFRRGQACIAYPRTG
jgi:hypothetical protein